MLKLPTIVEKVGGEEKKNNKKNHGTESRQEAPGGFEDVGRLMRFHTQFIKNNKKKKKEKQPNLLRHLHLNPN